MLNHNISDKANKGSNSETTPSLNKNVAGWSSPVARQAHNLKVVGSNPTPATNFSELFASSMPASSAGFVF